jgi:hypothetical protein
MKLRLTVSYESVELLTILDNFELGMLRSTEST